MCKSIQQKNLYFPFIFFQFIAGNNCNYSYSICWDFFPRNKIPKGREKQYRIMREGVKVSTKFKLVSTVL